MVIGEELKNRKLAVFQSWGASKVYVRIKGGVLSIVYNSQSLRLEWI